MKGEISMGLFNVNFSQTIPYGDPEFRSIYLEVKGEALVACADREGSDSDIDYVKTIIETTLGEQIFNYDKQQISYKDLPSKSSEIGQAVAAVLGERNITVNTFRISSIAPDARTQERINSIEKAKAFSAMSPQEQMKVMEEANRRAQESLSKLSEEQRRQAEEQAKKLMEQQAADIQRIMDQVNQMKAAAAGSTAAATAAAAVASAEPPKKKFCPNCGTPVGTGRFCAGCGNPL